MNRSNIAELITSKYGTPSSQTGIRGVGSNEAYRTQVDSLLDQPTHRRAPGGSLPPPTPQISFPPQQITPLPPPGPMSVQPPQGSLELDPYNPIYSPQPGFLSKFMGYIKNVGRDTFKPGAKGEGFLADVGRQFSPSTMAMVEKTATPAAPEEPPVPSSPTITVGGTTAAPAEVAAAPAESNILKAFKEIAPGMTKEALKYFINKKYESDDSFTPTHAGRSSQQNRGRNVSFNPIAGSGFRDGGRLLGRELYLGGGEIDGPGGPREDLVPVWASDDEYVVSADAVERIGNGDHAAGISTLDRINFR